MTDFREANSNGVRWCAHVHVACTVHDGLKFSLRTRIGEQSFDGYEMRYTHVATILKRCWLGWPLVSAC